MRSLLRIEARNYGCLDHADVTLGPLSVLVGPNGSGKSMLLDTIQFLGDAARDDLGPAVARRGGFEPMLFRGASDSVIRLAIHAVVTRYASERAADEYELKVAHTWIRIKSERTGLLRRTESFKFKRRAGAGRRLTIEGSELTAHDEAGKRIFSNRQLLQEQSLALSTRPGGATPDKPVGTTWVGLSTMGVERARVYQFSGDRVQNKTSFANAALEFLLEYLRTGA